MRTIQSSKMRYFLLAILLTGVGRLVQAQNAEIVDKVVAIVGSELVLLSEVEEQRALMEAQQGVLPENARCQILDNVLSSKLLVNQAKLDSIEVSDEEVETQLNARIDRILTLMGGDTKQFEAYYGQTVPEVKAQFREDLRNQLLSERMRNTVFVGATVTPSEVKNFFARIPADSLPYFNSEVEIGEIVVYPEVNDVERQKAIDELTAIRQRIAEGGEDFAELAGKYSDDPGSARAGGDLGWTKRGSFVPEFEAAAYNLEKGELSDLVESEFGFHLIQLMERRGNTIRTRHILIKPEITEADLELTRARLDTVRQLIQTDSLSFSRAVKRYSNENAQSFNNDGRMVNPATGNTFFEIGDLDPDVYFTVDTMTIGDVSAPFRYEDERGEVSFRLVQLQSRTQPHRANLREDYNKIRTAALEARKAEFVQNWLREKVDATYIMIDPMYDGCDALGKWRKTAMKP